MIWPFKRKPNSKPPVFITPNEGWMPGDMAECVDKLIPSKSSGTPPSVGTQGMVLSVVRGVVVGTEMTGVGIRIMGHPHHWQCNCFRKIILEQADRTVSLGKVKETQGG